MTLMTRIFLIQSVIVNQYSAFFVIRIDSSPCPPERNEVQRRISGSASGCIHVDAHEILHFVFDYVLNDKVRKTLHAASLHHFA